jgi:ATP-dependent DNA helicase DinG
MIGLHEDSGPDPRPPSRAVELTGPAFAEGGWLQANLGLDHRPEQARMAGAVAAAFRDDAPLLFEAGTGVGKSLAYLVPGIVHATDCGRQMIVSTHTIALQQQIQTQDLPLCRRLFRAADPLQRYAEFQSAVLLGKSNYLCTSRLAHALADRGTLFADAAFAELQRIAAWAETSATGVRHDLQPAPSPEVWDAVNADSSSCSRRLCDCARCFYQRARARLRSAQVIIVNHALLFSLIAAGGARAESPGAEAAGVLFPGDFVVLDEAHTVPEVAEANFGLALSSFGVGRTLKHLFNPRTNRGILAKLGGPEACQLVANALEAANQFFDFLGRTLLSSQDLVRIRETGAAEPLLAAPLAALQHQVAKLADRLEDGRERDELLDQRARLTAIQQGTDEWLTLGDEGHVYWAERGSGRETVTLRSAPIDVAPELRRRLFATGVSVVCTSATLAVAGTTAHFAARIGAGEARAEVVHSPFDFARHMRVYLAADVPAPSLTDSAPTLASLADYITWCCGRVAGGTLVLFTSHRDLRAVAAAVEPDLRAQGRTLLRQGGEWSRTELVRQMRELGRAVLFGTDSFWMGIDIPGDALAQVIVTRLPFSPPTHPVAEAKAEAIRARGGDAFQELTLPDAVVKFRQGVGRLIRTRTDRGLITVLDSRILAKSYGRFFVASLPQPEFTRLTRANRDAEFQPYPPRENA